MDAELETRHENSLASSVTEWIASDNAKDHEEETIPHEPRIKKEAIKREFVKFSTLRKTNWKRGVKSKKWDSSTDVDELPVPTHCIQASEGASSKLENIPSPKHIQPKRISNYSLPARRSSSRTTIVPAQRVHVKKIGYFVRREEKPPEPEVTPIPDEIQEGCPEEQDEPEIQESPKNLELVPTKLITPKKRKETFRPQRPSIHIKASSIVKKGSKEATHSKKSHPTRYNASDHSSTKYYNAIVKMSKMACSVLQDRSENGINRLVGNLKTQILYELMTKGDRKGVDAADQSRPILSIESSPEKTFDESYKMYNSLVTNNASMIRDTLVKSPSINDVPKTHGKYSFLSMSHKTCPGDGKVKLFNGQKPCSQWMAKVEESESQDLSYGLDLTEPVIEEV